MFGRGLIAALMMGLAAGPGAGQDGRFEQTDPRFGLLTPIPDRGGVPPIVEIMAEPTQQELNFRAASRRYARQIRGIRHEYLGNIRVPEIRARGIEALGRLKDPAAIEPMIEALRREQDDVRLFMLDHFTGLGDHGQAALAALAIHDEDESIRYEALVRLTRPASEPVLRVLDSGLRDPKHAIANRAGTVAGAVGAIQAIPLLIFAQATADPVGDGDLAWIAIGTQRAFVAAVEPVVGSAAGAFQPIPGVIQEGAILRVVDAVAIFYRTEVNRSLVRLTTDDWGESTAHLGYDIKAWWEWYNQEYVPFKNEQLAAERLAEERGG